MATQDEYSAYRYALDVAVELLERGNSEDQCVYVNVSEEASWNRELLHVWSGPSQDRMEMRARVGDLEELWYWPGNLHWNAPELTNPRVLWGSPWPPGAIEPAQAASRIAERAGIVLLDRAETVDTRLGVWARMFAIACAILDDVPGPRPHYIHTTFHSGWGTYYMAFRQLAAPDVHFAISEEGHFAGVDEGLDFAGVAAFNLRDLVIAGKNRNHCVAQLRDGVNRLCGTTGDSEKALTPD